MVHLGAPLGGPRGPLGPLEPLGGLSRAPRGPLGPLGPLGGPWTGAPWAPWAPGAPNPLLWVADKFKTLPENRLLGILESKTEHQKVGIWAPGPPRRDPGRNSEPEPGFKVPNGGMATHGDPLGGSGAMRGALGPPWAPWAAHEMAPRGPLGPLGDPWREYLLGPGPGGKTHL